jgi:hypothetical protein
MTNDEIKKYPFKHYSLDLPLMKASGLLRNLMKDLEDQVGTSSANYEMRSEAQAESRGVTRWDSYDPKEYCNKPKHFSRTVFIKTSLGWMHHCCANELGIERLPNTYIEPDKEAIKATYSDRKHELELITEYRRRLAIEKGMATKKAQAEKLAQEREMRKAAKAAEKALMSPEQIANKKAARAQRKAERVVKDSLLQLISQGENLGGEIWGEKFFPLIP